jgi:hypothetical protein
MAVHDVQDKNIKTLENDDSEQRYVVLAFKSDVRLKRNNLCSWFAEF